MQRDRRNLFPHKLEHVGGLFFLTCFYDASDYAKSSFQFYHKCFLWLCEFLQMFFASESGCKNVIWNNKERNQQVRMQSRQTIPSESLRQVARQWVADIGAGDFIKLTAS